MPQSLDIQIKTLTPLWTGGVDGTCDQLHISGLMGSLRYWYEAIVRGVGAYACDPSNDPTNGGGCIYKPLDKAHPENTGTKSICAACYLFGTTGWARLFRLSTRVEKGKDYQIPTENVCTGLYHNEQRKFNRLQQGIKGIDDTTFLPFTAHFRTIDSLNRHGDGTFAYDQLKMVLGFIATYGGLGPKQQKKRGSVEIKFGQGELSGDTVFFQQQLGILQKYAPKQHDHPEWKPLSEECPNLNQFFSFTAKHSLQPAEREAPRDRQRRYGIKTESPIKISAIRYWLEQKMPAKSKLELDALLGTIDNKAQASRIFLDFQKMGGEYFLHVYGFGVNGDSLKDKVVLTRLLEEYIKETWAGATILPEKKWDGSFLSAIGGK